MTMEMAGGAPMRVAVGCDHGVKFDEARWRMENLPAHHVREAWPRLFGKCPEGCGFEGIAYASWAHYAAGDW